MKFSRKRQTALPLRHLKVKRSTVVLCNRARGFCKSICDKLYRRHCRWSVFLGHLINTTLRNKRKERGRMLQRFPNPRACELTVTTFVSVIRGKSFFHCSKSETQRGIFNRNCDREGLRSRPLVGWKQKDNAILEANAKILWLRSWSDGEYSFFLYN